MSRLMKAEWYRIRKSAHLMAWIIFVAAFVQFITIVNISSLGETVNGSRFLGMQISNTTDSYVFIVLLASVVAAMGYIYKTSHYEPMQGNNIHHILISRVTVVTAVIVVINVLAIVLTYAFFCVTAGKGEVLQAYNFDGEAVRVSMSVLATRYAYLLVMVVQKIACAVLLVCIFKNGLSIAFIYMFEFAFSMVHLMVLGFVSDSTDETKKFVSMLFTNERIYELSMFGIDLPSYFLPVTIIEAVGEIVLLYFIAHRLYKKQVYFS